MTEDEEYNASLLKGHIKSLRTRQEVYRAQALHLEQQALGFRERVNTVQNQIDVAEKVLHNLEGEN